MRGLVPLVFVRTGDSRSANLEAFFNEVTGLADCVRGIVRDGRQRLPAFLLGQGWSYCGVPTGRELQPFLQLLSLQEEPEPAVPESILLPLLNMRKPVSLRLYVTSACPQCPHVVRNFAPLPFRQPALRIQVIDATLFPEEAGRDDVRSTPSMIWKDDVRWTGNVPMEEVLGAVSGQGELDLGAETIISMVREGEAARLARLMLREKRLFSGLPEALVHPEFSVRLGAMVAMEEVVKSDPELARGILPELWQWMEQVPVSVKGDIVYLVGEVGSSEWQGILEEFLSRYPVDDDGIQELGQEALRKISDCSSNV